MIKKELMRRKIRNWILYKESRIYKNKKKENANSENKINYL